MNVDDFLPVGVSSRKDWLFVGKLRHRKTDGDDLFIVSGIIPKCEYSSLNENKEFYNNMFPEIIFCWKCYVAHVTSTEIYMCHV